jgi:O-antigen ligase
MFTRRGLAAPLLFLALAFASYGSVEASPAVWLGAVVLLVLAAWALPAPSPSLSVLSVAVGGFAAWLILTNEWMSPSYSAAAPYQAAFLMGGFVVGRRAGLAALTPLFVAAVALVLCLAGWALWQEARNPAQRAHALFETPATLAATINLLLVPCLVLLAFGHRGLFLLIASALLSAAVMAAGSLGGWLAIAFAAVLALGFARRGRLEPHPESLVLATVTLAAGWLIAWGLPILWSSASPLWGGAGSPAALAEAVHDPINSSAARLDLYRLALDGLSISSWLTGYGYLGFYYLMEAGRGAVGTYGPSTTYFVHNDYLQVLLELGVPGLALFACIVTLPMIRAWQALPRVALRERLILLCALGAACTMMLHALVDFPFYIPVCVIAFGVAIGVIDSIASEPGPPAAPGVGRRAAIAAVATIWALLLVKPVAAEAAAAHAQRQWRTAQAQNAAYWFEVARRIEPRDWRFHWYAGQFWYAQARRGGKPPAAQLADDAFAAGFAANPREVRNLSGRITVQRELRWQLESPASDAVLRAWAEEAARLAPFDPNVQRQSARVLKDLAPRKGSK